MKLRCWIRDLGLGARFVLAGGPADRLRGLLTAVGAGLGVALLLLATAVPHALSARDQRRLARQETSRSARPMPASDRTLLIADVDTRFRESDIRGRLLEPEGANSPLPPGLSSFPAPGEMAVSPALERLLRSPGARLLRERLPYHVTGTIAEAGLVGPDELAYYAGTRQLSQKERGSNGFVSRIDHFGAVPDARRGDPVLLLLTLLVVVALLTPIGVFVAAAVRFGGERRDRRLAALRLVGADAHTARRIAAGESLVGALLGLVLGAGLFVLGRRLAGHVAPFGVSVFPSDLVPAPLLAALVAVAVPGAAVGVTVLALRRVTAEPLGVVRSVRPAGRRLWWRLLLPAAGFVLLAPELGRGDGQSFHRSYVVTASVLVLLGVTALLPWAVDRFVGRLGGGPLSWQLAVRRLQSGTDSAGRGAAGITVAVAGAIALQMLFAAVDADYVKSTGDDLSRAQMVVMLPPGTSLSEGSARLARVRGVRGTDALYSAAVGDSARDPGVSAELTVGSCAALREVARLDSCRDGDVFAAPDPSAGSAATTLGRAGTLYIDSSYGSYTGLQIPFRMPAGGAKRASARPDPAGSLHGGILATPGAVPGAASAALQGTVYVRLDEAVPDARDEVRTAAAALGPLADAVTMVATRESARYASIRTALFIGAALVSALIGAGLLVSQLEQLQDRGPLLAFLRALGTPRRTLGLSLLWQTALPVAVGLLPAAATGLALGAVLQRMSGGPVRADWPALCVLGGIGASLALLVTVLSVPVLLRLVRAEGLRTE
ncbi:FtsX-like permease family protein [Streptomyces sp. RM1]